MRLILRNSRNTCMFHLTLTLSKTNQRLEDTLTCVFPSSEENEDSEIEVIGFNKQRIRELKKKIKILMKNDDNLVKESIRIGDIIKPQYWNSRGKNKSFKVKQIA